jgi:hypothetical protein
VLGCHDIHIKFHKDWFWHLKDDAGGFTDTHRQQGDPLSLRSKMLTNTVDIKRRRKHQRSRRFACIRVYVTYSGIATEIERTWLCGQNTSLHDHFYCGWMHVPANSNCFPTRYVQIKRVTLVRQSPIVRRRYGAVGIAAGYGLDGREVEFESRQGQNLSSPRRPGRFWGPPRPLSNWYRGALSSG